MRYFASLLVVLFLTACSLTPKIGQDSLGGPKLDLEEYFDGTVKAYGQFQDVFGKVRRRFDVTITGQWDGTRLVLEEDFIYEDGSTEKRIWTLLKTGPDTWEGTAAGVLGTARGIEKDDTFNWAYSIDLPVPDGVLRVDFDDWMWRLDEWRVLNRAYMTRFGLRIGEVIIFFEKLD